MYKTSTKELALRVARMYYEQRLSRGQIAKEIGKSLQTVARLLKEGQEGSWWRLIVQPEVKTADSAPLNEDLANQIRSNTRIPNVLIVKTSDVDEAYTEDYLSNVDDVRKKAFLASDSLHSQLAKGAARYLLDILHNEFVVGVSSGRGVMYTAMAVHNLIEQGVKPPRGLHGLCILSLSGGSKVTPWATQNSMDLDADNVAFELAKALNANDNVVYITGPVSADKPALYLSNLDRALEEVRRMDIAIVGLGVLNSGHHLLRLPPFQTRTIQEQLEIIKQEQTNNSELLTCIADICLRLFWAGSSPAPTRIASAIETINRKLVTVSEEALKRTREIILVAAGQQKLPALLSLCYQEDLAIPIRIESLTLVTDEWTAKKLLEGKPK
jgi:DNA-binding transcriptional regulator LsrR (DeoR family)